MKKSKLSPLTLSKETIALLDARQLNAVMGGVSVLRPSGSGTSTGCGTGGSGCTTTGTSTGCGGGTSQCIAR